MAKLSIITLYKRRLNRAQKNWEKELDERFAELYDSIDVKCDALERETAHKVEIAKQ